MEIIININRSSTLTVKGRRRRVNTGDFPRRSTQHLVKTKNNVLNACRTFDPGANTSISYTDNRGADAKFDDGYDDVVD